MVEPHRMHGRNCDTEKEQRGPLTKRVPNTRPDQTSTKNTAGQPQAVGIRRVVISPCDAGGEQGEVMEDLIITHKKGKSWWFIATVVVFLWLYRSAYSGNPTERVWVLDVLAVVFIGYMSLLCFCADSVQIKLAERVVMSSTRTLFWRKTFRYRVEVYNFVVIVRIMSTNNRGSFKIGLMRGMPAQNNRGSFKIPESENQKIDWILGCWPSEFAWDSTVRIAKHLNLPVYDMMVKEGRIWEEKEVPLTLSERKMRIESN